jgi:replicative DNA helicase
VAIACIPEGDFSPQKVLEKIDRTEQKTQTKIKAFMCDYLQKMTENDSSKNNRTMRDEELENTVNQIKDICQEKKSFGIVISQVPSHAAGGAQEFLSLKQAVARSYAATWGAHYVVTMNRTAEETRRLASSATDKRPRLNLFLCKNKDGPLGVCHALGFPDQARWEFYRDKASMEKSIEYDNI